MLIILCSLTVHTLITLLSRRHAIVDEMDKNTPENEGYHAYILRLWVESQEAAEPVWRFVLLDPQTGQQHGFRSIEALSEFLDELIHTGDKGKKDLAT